MSDYLTEQEQVELLKSWIKQYSKVVLLGVFCAIVAIFAWREWQHHQTRLLTHASRLYDSIITSRAQNDTAKSKEESQKLIKEYPRTAYADFALLMTARDAILKENYAEAESALKTAIRDSHSKGIKQIAKLRLARVYIQQKDAKKALDTIKDVDDNTFIGLIEEVQGDAYLFLKDIAKAKIAYQNAIAKLPNAESIRPLLQMKLDNLATES